MVELLQLILFNNVALSRDTRPSAIPAYPSLAMFQAEIPYVHKIQGQL